MADCLKDDVNVKFSRKKQRFMARRIILLLSCIELNEGTEDLGSKQQDLMTLIQELFNFDLSSFFTIFRIFRNNLE